MFSSLHVPHPKSPSEVKFSEPVRDGKVVDGKLQISTKLDDYYFPIPPRQDALEVDVQDADTPDKWIKRHKDMVRLTGRHPFNSEAKLSALQAAGWVTPPSLTVVRNHGAVPKIDFDSHRLEVSGVPAGSMSLSMADLQSGKFGPQVSIPVTFICAGNRRKEQNMTKKTIGFNWGCAAIGNTVWTGVRLCDVLNALGIKRISKEHRFVHFEGPEGELPQGDRGVYGTSIDMGWALDRERDVLLAFKQNGELLTPDHGAPLRTLLPGCIGGRMIKWLCKMWVSSEPSTSHYHFFDNRVLPPHVDADLATKEGWWFKDEYIINHMNLNSAMFEPRHNSYFKLQGPKVAKTMKVCGYAYVGGGLKIIRAEISLDSGKTWEIADLTRPEDAIAAARGTDKHWCWSWWETEVEAHKLKDCKEICCRAVDSNQTMQPMFLTWNVMGMMNNCLFRVKVHPLEDGSGVWFEHPTMPGNQPGGWMTEDAGKYNPSIATECAAGKHGQGANRPVAAQWHYALAVPKPMPVGNGDGTFLNPRQFQKLPLIEKITVSHDTRIFRFGLPDPAMKLGLPTGQHMFLKAKWKDQTVMRPYTPLTDDHTLGHVDLLIKVYFANVHPKFPEGGKMSQSLESMKIGDVIEVKGPLGEFNYKGKGAFTWHGKLRTCSHISMIAGGTGLTPCFQVAQAILRDPDDKTKVSLLYANQTPNDILAREELEKLQREKGTDRFKLWYTVDRVPDVQPAQEKFSRFCIPSLFAPMPHSKAEEWRYSVGFVNERLIRDHVFEPEEGRITVMCGPPMMMEKACKPNLLSYGYKESDIFVF
mmetsp:Transcript_25439/g.45227  ORF Transcript_25439/g.45227 Transcript_25439/m.45227 type:complete len:813 (+) Transcript_25439:102-2540(+)